MTTGQQAVVCPASGNLSENHAVVVAPNNSNSGVSQSDKVRAVLRAVDTVHLSDLADTARTTPDEWRTFARTIFTDLDEGGYAARAYNAGAEEYVRKRYREFRRCRPDAIRAAIEHAAENPPKNAEDDQPVQRWKALLADARTRDARLSERERETQRAEAERRKEAEEMDLREAYREKMRRVREWCEQNPNADADAIESLAASESGGHPEDVTIMRRRIRELLRESAQPRRAAAGV